MNIVKYFLFLIHSISHFKLYNGLISLVIRIQTLISLIDDHLFYPKVSISFVSKSIKITSNPASITFDFSEYS